jgi:hypothetical protein
MGENWPTPDPDECELRALLESLDKSTLVALLSELGLSEQAVRERLQRFRLSADPARLAAEFKRRLERWRRGSGLISYKDSRDFADELQAWLDQVERELLPVDPPRALALFERLIESDGALMDRADDSDGYIGGAFRSACVGWLRAAARCNDANRGRVERLYELAKSDEYGVREELLRRADLRLDEPELRRLVARFEGELDQVLNKSRWRSWRARVHRGIIVYGACPMRSSRGFRNGPK